MQMPASRGVTILLVCAAVLGLAAAVSGRELRQLGGFGDSQALSQAVSNSGQVGSLASALSSAGSSSRGYRTFAQGIGTVYRNSRNRGLRAPWVQNLAAAYARSASFGRSGVTATATAIATAIGTGGDSQSANTLAIAAAFVSGDTSVVVAVAAVINAYGCDYVEQTIVQAQAIAINDGQGNAFAAASASVSSVNECLGGNIAEARASASAGNFGDTSVISQASAGAISG